MAIYYQTVYDRIAAGGVEDVAVTTHDLHLDVAQELTLALAQDIATWHDNFFAELVALISNNLQVREYRFYDDYNGDGSPGEVDFIVESSFGGASVSAMLPPQCACTITEIIGIGNAGRRFWGRWYMPGLAVNALADDGRWSNAAVTAIADAAETLYDDLHMNDGSMYPAVWTKQGPTPPILVPVTKIRVDNTVDIQRRRRWDVPTLRNTRTIPIPP